MKATPRERHHRHEAKAARRRHRIANGKRGRAHIRRTRRQRPQLPTPKLSHRESPNFLRKGLRRLNPFRRRERLPGKGRR